MLAGSTDDGVVGLDRSFGAVSSARCTMSRALADFIDSCFVGGGASSTSGGGSDCCPTEFVTSIWPFGGSGCAEGSAGVVA